MKPHLHALAALAALAVAVVAPPALADDAAARAQFKKGIGLYDARRYAEAVEAFRAAYREKPSAIIKQNIALSLEGMGNNVEAAAAFDEALEEGKATLAPETRDAIERELSRIAATIATLELHVVSASNRRPIDGALVRVDGVPLAPGALNRPIRLAPGVHVITAHVDGYADPPEKKLGLVAGSPVDATFEMGPAVGTVTIRPDVPGSTIEIDGAVVGHGGYAGPLAAGTHRVEVTAPDSRATTMDIVVTAGVAVDYPIAVAPAGDVPVPYEYQPVRPPKKLKRWYAVVGGGFESENLQLSTELGERAGTRRDFKGGALALRGGHRLSRFFSVELHAELGSASSTYRPLPADPGDTKTTLSHWQVTPGARFTTLGKLRFTTATGFGVHGMHLESTPPVGGSRPAKAGTTITPSWLIDFGAQLDAGPIFFEGLLFFDVHGVGTLRDDATNERLLMASPAARVGLRIGLGLSF